MYLLIMQEIRVAKDYEAKTVYLPSRSFGAVTINIWVQMRGSGNPRNNKVIKPKNIDYKAAKLKVIFGVKNQVNLGRHDEIWKLLDWNGTH